MKKAFRTPIVAVVASVAMVAVGVAPALAAPSKSSVLANALAMKSPISAQSMGGSSFDANLVSAAYNQWKSDNSYNGASLNAYASSSSGTGRLNMISGTFAIGFSDVPLNFAGQDTSNTSNYVQVPVALGGVGIIANINYRKNIGVKNSFGAVNTYTLTSNGTASGLTCAQLAAKYGVAVDGTTLANIYAGSVNSWGAPQVLATNPRLTVLVKVPYAKAIPAHGKKGTKSYHGPVPQKNHFVAYNCLSLATTLPITVVSRTAGSGTTFIFRDFLSKADPTEFPVPSSAAFTAAQLQFSSSGTLAPAVASKDGAIGYVEYGYALQNHLSTLRLKNAAGAYVALTASSVTAAASAGLAAINANKNCTSGFSTDAPSTYNAASVNTQCFSITDVKYSAAYPIAGFSYAIANKTISNNGVAILVTKFLLFLSQQGAGTTPQNTFGQNFAAAQAYVPLPTSFQNAAYSIIGRINNGTDLSATN